MNNRKNKLTNFLKIKILLFSISLLLWNCEKEDILISQNPEITILNIIKEKFNESFNSIQFKYLPKEPIWDKANHFNINGVSYTEIPFYEINKKDFETNNDINLHRLIACKNQENQITLNVIKYFAIDFKNNKTDFSQLSYKNTEKFNGYITLLTLKNEVINTSRYIKGTKSKKKYNYITNKITDKNNVDKQLFSKMSSGIICSAIRVSYTCTRTCLWEGNPGNIVACSDWDCEANYYTPSDDCVNEDGEAEGTSYSNQTILEETEDEDDEIDDSQLTGKEKCLNEKLTKNGNTFVKDILKKFQGNSEFDINIKSLDKVFPKGITTGNGVDGITRYTKGSSLINIEISTSKLSNMPALAAARTLIHEYIHADMYRKLYTKYATQGDLDFRKTYEEFENGNFKATPQHESMAKLYVNSMRDALKNFHKNVLVGDYNYLTSNGTNPLTDNFYEALAWQGLKDHNVKAYSDLTDAKKIELTNALNAYYHSTTKNCPN